MTNLHKQPHRQNQQSIALLVGMLVSVGLLGCGTHTVGLRDKLQPPPMHDNNLVKGQRSSWERAQKVYHKRQLALRKRILMRGYQDQDSGLRDIFIIQGISTPVHWQELLEVAGKKKLLATLLERRRRTNLAVGTISLLLTLGCLSVGGTLLGLSLTTPNPTHPGQLNPDIPLLAGGALFSAVGLVALIGTFWGYTGNFGVEPALSQLEEAVEQYNRQLKRTLGLHQKAPPLPPINVGP